MIAFSMALLACLPQGFISSEVTLDSPDASAALRDMNRDGRPDLVALADAGVSILYQREDGSFPAEFDTQFDWPGQRLGWDLVDWDNDNSYELICLDGEGAIRLWRAGDDGQFETPLVLLENTGSLLPPGLRRLRFARDLDGDGLLDIVVPRGSSFRVFVRSEAAVFKKPHEVRFEAEFRSELGQQSVLASRLVQSISIPWFRIEDIDGDGRSDLVAETEDRVTFFLSAPELPSEPTWSLDLAALRASLPEEEEFSFDNLITQLTPSVRWRIAEVNGVAPAELIVQTGDTLKLYAGGSRLGITESPAQILRASGPILYFFLRQTSSRTLPDLQIVRSEDLSLGRLLRWIVLPGELKFDLYTYENQAGTEGAATFGRKPSKRNTLAVELPRLLSIEERIENLEEGFADRMSVPARVFALDRDAVFNDVVDFSNGSIRFYRDRCPDGFEEDIPGLAEGDLDRLIEHFLLEDLDDLGNGKTKTFGIEDIFNLSLSRGHELRAICEGVSPAFEVALLIPVEEALFTPYDYDSDGLTDLIAWGRDEDDRLRLQFLRRVVE